MISRNDPAWSWLANAVDADGRVLGPVVLLDHLEGLVPVTALEAGAVATLFPEGFAKPFAVIRQTREFALVHTGGETGPRRPPVELRRVGDAASCRVMIRINPEQVWLEEARLLPDGDGMVVDVRDVPPEFDTAGAAVLIDGGLVALLSATTRGRAGVVALTQLFTELDMMDAEHSVWPGAIHWRTGVLLQRSLTLARTRGHTVDAPVMGDDVLLASMEDGTTGADDEKAALYLALSPPDRADRVQAALTAAGVSAAPVDPVPDVDQPLGPALEGLVSDAIVVARRTGNGNETMVRHVLAVTLTDRPPSPAVLAALGVGIDDLRVALRTTIARLWPGDDQAAWDAVLRPTPLAGGFNDDQSGRRDEAGRLCDELGARPYATMLATLIASHNTPMPLSIGLFGEWGSGKTYFMELLKDEVNALAGSSAAYHRHVVQLTFNAWHYSDTNLWASLGAEFFDQLLRPRQDDEEGDVKRRQHIEVELADKRRIAQELRAEQDKATREVGKLRGQLSEAEQQRRSRTRALDRSFLGRMVSDPTIKPQLEELGNKLGLGVPVEQVARVVQQVDGIQDDLAATRAILLRRGWRPTFWIVAIAIAILAAAVATSGALAKLLGTGSIALVVAAIGTVGRAVGQARSAVTPLRTLAEKIAETEERLRNAPDRTEQRLSEELAVAEGQEAVLRKRLDDAVAVVADLDRELAELHPGRQLYRFIADRAASVDYRGQLGIMSTVRRDFEDLRRLMRVDWPSDAVAEGIEPIDRIVLYIDDLDRCEPAQVVAVLQAVHLLLAMDLFVVVVGVDPRWLLRSVRREFRQLLGVTAGRDGYWATTPQNYLEKIFQVPFVLPRMDQAGFEQLLRGMTGATEGERSDAARIAIDAGPTPGGTAQAPADEAAADQPLGPPAEPSADLSFDVGSEVSQLAKGLPPIVERELTPPELDLLAAMHELVPTPRAAKRLFNVYRLLRSTRAVWPGTSFLGGAGRAGEYEAVVQLLAILTAYPEELGVLMWGERRDGSVQTRGLCRTPVAAEWPTFVAGLKPREIGARIENDVADDMDPAAATRWRTLVTGLEHLFGLGAVRLADLEPYRQWAPKVARFSFLLSQFADDEPAPRPEQHPAVISPGP